MLREAGAYMVKNRADFIITGEVMGQRPFSQLKSQMNHILKKSELSGKLLRPLCAKHLPPTEPELNGLVNREQLLDIKGRGRKQQIMLAEQFGLIDYPAPAGGCLLTDAGFSNRLIDLINHTQSITTNDIELLKIGRHFRLDNATKVIVGRNEKENQRLEELTQSHHLTFEVSEIPSPLSLLIGNADDKNINTAALLTARYSSARMKSEVKIKITLNGQLYREIIVNPATDFDHTLKAIT